MIKKDFIPSKKTQSRYGRHNKHIYLQKNEKNILSKNFNIFPLVLKYYPLVANKNQGLFFFSMSLDA